MSPPEDFELPDSTLRVLKGLELANDSLYRKYLSYINKKTNKFSKNYFDPRNPKMDFGGILGNRSRVGSVEVASLARGVEERANARDEREVTVYGNSLRSANNPLCNRFQNR